MAKILLVDDDEGFRTSVRRLLKTMGHDVRVAENGTAAYAAMRADPADVVLMDVYMPGEDGIEATSRLAADFPGVRVVVTTGGGALTPDVTLRLARHVGALATLPKPFSRDLLAQTLQRVLATGQHGPTEAQATRDRLAASRVPAGGGRMVTGAARDDVGAEPVESTAGLAELTQARDAAEAANRAKSAFLATITHEMRTPMNGVLGMAEILLGTSLTAEQQEAVELIRTSATGLLGLINDVLEFSRIESGHLDLENVAFDVGATARSVSGLLAPQAAQGGVELVCRVDAAVPTLVRGDPGRVRQAVTNLVGNAVKFTHEGTIEVLVSPEPGGCCLAVRDTGIGIPADKLQHIFEEFEQVDASRTRRYGGSGLGLAITRRLVEAMGGRLEASSTLGSGSEFRIHLPLPAAGGGSPEEPSAAELRGLRVLVAADDLVAGAQLRQRLAAAGARVDATEEGLATMERLRAAVTAGDLYRAVVIDLQFGGGSGFALAEAIRSEPLLASLPVVLLMPAGLRGDGQRCRNLGIDAYFTEPAAPDDVLRAVRAAVARRNATGTPGPLITRHSLEAGRPSMHVLLAEDVAINQKVACHLLAQRGHRVDVVEHGRAAVDAVRHVPYDVVLMDVGMPEMDGIAATREIRRDPRFATLPIVAVTAHARDSDRVACLQAGMNAFLTKPFRPADLFAVVERFGPAAPGPGDPAVDVAGLRSTLAHDGMESLAHELLVIFRQEAPGRYAAMQEAIRAGDRARIADTAHALKSSAGAIRAGRLAASLRAVEAAAREGRDDLAGPAGDVTREYEQTIEFLQGVIPGARPDARS